ncbi:MAG: PilZ domain-containing protein [Chakrabartia sp.]
MQIAARLAVHSPTPDDRRKSRAPVAIAANLGLGGFHGHNVIIRDISEFGFKVEADLALTCGAIIRLRIPGLGVVIGRVVWLRGGFIGGEFVNPLNATRLSMVLGFRGKPQLS